MPKLTADIIVRLDGPTIKPLDAMAAKNDSSRSFIIRRYLFAGLDLDTPGWREDAP